MTQRQMATLACKILGIYAIIRSLEVLSIALIEVAMPRYLSLGAVIGEVLPPLILVLSPGVSLLALGFGLIIFADKVAALIADDSPVTLLQIEPRTLQSIAFSVTGVFILLQGVPVIIQLVFQFYYGIAGSLLRIPHEFGPSMILIALVKIPVGLYLLFGARGLVRLLPDIGRD